MIHFFCHCSCKKILLNKEMSGNKACACVPEGFEIESKYEWLLSSCDMIYLPADGGLSWLLSVVAGPLLTLL